MTETCRAEHPALLCNLQALRAIAAYMVVLHHIGTGFVERSLGLAWPAVGAAGVDIFFVLSGVVMVYTVRGGRGDPAAFLQRRILRIAPLYTLVTTVVFALCLAGLQPQGLAQADGTLAQYLKSILYIPFVRANGPALPLVTVGWTLNYEAFFYVLFALALTVRRHVPPALAATALIAALVLAGIAMPGRQGLLVAFYTNPIMLEFAAGMLIAAALLDDARGCRGDTVPGALLCACGVVWFAATALLGVEVRLFDAQRALVWGVPAAAIVAGALMLERGGLRLTTPALRLQGDASYAIYLAHLLVIQVATRLLSFAFGAPDSAWAVWAQAGLFLALSALFGTMLHLHVEVPLTTLVRSSKVKNRSMQLNKKFKEPIMNEQ